MEPKGLVIIFGSLLITVILIVLGALYSKWILALGVLALIVWIIFVFNIALAMSSDI